MSRIPCLVLDGLVPIKPALGNPGAIPPLSLTIQTAERVALLAGRATDAASQTGVDRLADVDKLADVDRLADVIAGHARPDAGRILLDGADITMLPPAQRRIGVISTRDPLFGHLSVHDNVAFPLAARRLREPERGHRVRQTLALLGLEAQAAQHPAALDPAAAFRVALARILVLDPALVLLDDPLRLLDPSSRRAMHQLLRRLARARSLTLLFITRDREEALMMGDRIGILDGPHLRQIGTATELLDRPADEKVASSFGEANCLTGQVEWVEDDVARVRLSAGPSMEAMATDGLVPGALCVVCIRPERVATAFVTGASDALGDDALPATLLDVVHLGDHLRLRFRLTGGGELLVRRPASQPTSGLRADRPALLAWQPAHATAFAQDDFRE